MNGKLNFELFFPLPPLQSHLLKVIVVMQIKRDIYKVGKYSSSSLSRVNVSRALISLIISSLAVIALLTVAFSLNSSGKKEFLKL